MNYGFLINNKTCIGCHACSVACKSENRVPLGVSRTWVKYVEKGKFPHTRRLFQVTRCNHCANPPCVRICPVTAMYQRHDGIVEFDPTVCIGCKACMQACPYDAIYLDPETHTAAKCHFCSHRTDIGLEPACVVVCPTHSIIAGDIDDPHSEISCSLAREQVNVRKPEQGTAPKLFYIEGDDVTLTPTAALTGSSFMWADVILPTNDHRPPRAKPPRGTAKSEAHPEPSRRASSPRAEDSLWAGGLQLWDHPLATNNGQGATDKKNLTAPPGVPIRSPATQGLGYYGPIHIGEGRMAEHMIQTTYNAQHKVPWHWPVPAYLVTKGIGSGLFALMALFFGLNVVEFNPALALLGAFISLLFIGLTTLLLVLDLDKPLMFHTILTRPQWKSWLTRGAFLCVGFTSVVGSWFLIEGAAFTGLVNPALAEATRLPLLGLGFILAISVAIYTAFLFGQAEGRDLWQSSLLPVHLLVQACMVGAATLLALDLWVDMPARMSTSLSWILGVSLLVDLLVTLLGEFGMPHASEIAARAAHNTSHGRYRHYFWGGSIVLGHILPLVLLLGAALGGVIAPALVAIAALAVIAGLYLFEYAFVMAPQEVPNS